MINKPTDMLADQFRHICR